MDIKMNTNKTVSTTKQATNKHHLPHALKIIDVKTENATTKTFTLDGNLNAIPGQFVMVWLPDSGEKPFSLANATPIALTIAAVGPVSQAIHQLNVGDYLWIRGPLGQGYSLPTPKQNNQILLVGGGYGVAPMLFLAKTALAQHITPTMIIGARDSNHLLLQDNFEKLGISLLLSTEDGSTGTKGLVTDAMNIYLDYKSADAVYACGPTGMLQAIATLSQTKNIPYQLAWESYMRCGIGLCGSCEVGDGWLTCLDGPVFSFNPALSSS